MKEASDPRLLQGLVTLFSWLRKKCYKAFQQIFLGLHISLAHLKDFLTSTLRGTTFFCYIKRTPWGESSCVFGRVRSSCE